MTSIHLEIKNYFTDTVIPTIYFYSYYFIQKVLKLVTKCTLTIDISSQLTQVKSVHEKLCFIFHIVSSLVGNQTNFLD